MYIYSFLIYLAENCLMKVVFCINFVYALLIKKTTIMVTKPNWMLPHSNNEQVLVILWKDRGSFGAE